MLSDHALKVTRGSWPATCLVGSALAVALLGLPLPPDGPIHHRLLAYLVVAIVIFMPILPGRRAGSNKARRALFAVAATIAFFLYLGAFNTLIAGNDAGLQFIAAPIGFQVQTVRAILILLFAVFILLVTLIWIEPRGVICGSRVRAGPQGEDLQCRQADPGMLASADNAQASTASKLGNRRPNRRTSAASREDSQQGVAFERHATLATKVTSSVPIAANSSRFARAGTSLIVRCGLPVVAFFLICASPSGNSQTCHLAAEQAPIGTAVEQTLPMPELPLEATPKLMERPRAASQQGADAQKESGSGRIRGRPRVPADPVVNRAR